MGISAKICIQCILREVVGHPLIVLIYLQILSLYLVKFFNIITKGPYLVL